MIFPGNHLPGAKMHRLAGTTVDQI